MHIIQTVYYTRDYQPETGPGFNRHINILIEDAKDLEDAKRQAFRLVSRLSDVDRRVYVTGQVEVDVNFARDDWLHTTDGMKFIGSYEPGTLPDNLQRKVTT